MMKRSKLFRLALAVAVVSAPAWAVKAGDKLYIRSAGTKMLKTAAANGAVVAPLKPGDEVEWQEVDAKKKEFHKVKFGPKQGYVLQANLAPTKPQTESSSDGKSIDGRALAASGAATQSISESAKNLPKKKVELTEALQQVILLNAINSKITDKDVTEFAAKQGLPKAGGK